MHSIDEKLHRRAAGTLERRYRRIKPAFFAGTKKPGEFSPGFDLKDWRLPTLAEAIQPLPSAMQCLTAVFGMGTGRTTAVLPPNCVCTVLTCKKLIKNNSGFTGHSLKTTYSKLTGT